MFRNSISDVILSKTAVLLTVENSDSAASVFPDARYALPSKYRTCQLPGFCCKMRDALLMSDLYSRFLSIFVSDAISFGEVNSFIITSISTKIIEPIAANIIIIIRL